MKPSRTPRTPGRKPPPPPPPKPTPRPQNQRPRDPVEVYCRLRPVENIDEEKCIDIMTSTTVRMIAPEGSISARNGNIKETQYVFKYVFDDHTTQEGLFDRVGLPLVTDLLQGKNGLLFTYGVTGSGKTFTMTGTPENGGILPRCLDVIFNTITPFLARKYVFTPGKPCGFEIQSSVDAMVEQSKQLSSRRTASQRRDMDTAMQNRVSERAKVEHIDENSTYAVFVSYIEIYNNYVYDLLDENTCGDPSKQRAPQSKMIREDKSTGNMFIFGGVEVEVRTTEEAFEVFYTGQARRRMAHTSLNTESSRSHSVFTIRVVQVPYSASTEDLTTVRDEMCISQLSLVDLAGSERTVRTKNKGDRLREAGNINNSLMVLRTCMEVLRENQVSGTSRLVPYRDSKLTHLFKNYFDGEGKVRMIVCVNPRADDYDETIHVMRFAELTQEVQVARPMGTTPGARRRNNRQYRDVLERFAEANNGFTPSAPLVGFGPDFPPFMCSFPSDAHHLGNLATFLKERMEHKQVFQSVFERKISAFRNMLLNVEKENVSNKRVIESLNEQLQSKSQKLQQAESKLQFSEKSKTNMQKKLEEYTLTKRTLEYELDEKEMLINRRAMEKERLKSTYQDKLDYARSRIARDMERKMKQKEANLTERMKERDEQLRAVKDIVMSEHWSSGKLKPAPSTPNLAESNSYDGPQTRSMRYGITASISDPKISEIHRRSDPREVHFSNMAVANPRHRRSRSGVEVWADHRPKDVLELDTLMQPKLRRKRSMTQPNATVITKEADRYCLTHQIQDPNGDIETQLIKGNVIPSVSGGAQVVFDDVETLTQTSPDRKRSFTGKLKMFEGMGEVNKENLQDRCGYGIEGHVPSPIKPKKSK